MCKKFGFTVSENKLPDFKHLELKRPFKKPSENRKRISNKQIQNKRTHRNVRSQIDSIKEDIYKKKSRKQDHLEDKEDRFRKKQQKDRLLHKKKVRKKKYSKK